MVFHKKKKRYDIVDLRLRWIWIYQPIVQQKQARNQSGQTKPYVSRLGICQCYSLKIEISGCNEFGFFGHLLNVKRKIFLTSLITYQNKAIRLCFPRCNYGVYLP